MDFEGISKTFNSIKEAGMRYLIAFLLVIGGLVPFVLEGDATVLGLMFVVSMFLIWSKKDWTKGPYEKRRQQR